MNKFWYSAFSTIGLLFFTVPAMALTINPARLTVTVAKGEAQVISLAVRNDSKEIKKYNLGVVSVEQDIAGRPVFRAGVGDAETWVTPEKSEFNIAPGKTAQAFFSVKVPSTAAGGIAHFVGLTVTESATGTLGVGLSSKLVSLVELQVAGFIQEHGVLNLWSAKNFFYGDLNWPMSVSVANTGTGSAPLKGRVLIKNVITQKTAEQIVSLGSALLPGTSRQISVVLKAPDSLSAGIYAVKINLVYGYTGQQLVRTTYIVYLPKPVQLVVLILSILFVLIVVKIIKRKKMDRY